MYMIRSVVFLLGLMSSPVISTHIKGSFRPDSFFKFLAKFGFQKTDIHSRKDSYGYIFGNITADYDLSVPLTFAVLDGSHFLEYYKNRDVADKEDACRRMFHKLNYTAYHPKCNVNGRDFLRAVPCQKDRLCIDEDTPLNVVKGNQFTYVIENLDQPRFWYVSLVSCYRNITTCEWHYYDIAKLRPKKSAINATDIEIKYDFWLVNGNPNISIYNTLLYQFSFDRQNTLEMYLLFWVCYMILLPLQIYAVKSQHHPVTRLFTFSLILEFIGLCLMVVHNVKFGLDGVGFASVDVAGDILDILSRATFMLLLLLLAKGWAVTRLELTWKPVVFGIWLCYGVVHVLLYVWNKTEVDIIEEIDEYQTWPGWLILALRVLIMAWFVFELRNTMLYEHNMVKLDFLLHFGASSLVWFIYLPVIALVALKISPLWRFKFLLGITYSADCMAFCVMAHLLWPTRSEQYLLLTPADYPGLEELDEFNESPHIVHGSSESSMAPLQAHTSLIRLHDSNSNGAVQFSDSDNVQNHDRFSLNGDDDEVLFSAQTQRLAHKKNAGSFM